METPGSPPAAPARCRRAGLGLLLALLASGAGLAQERQASEAARLLSAAPPPGWKMSYSYSVPGLEVREFLPRGQSLENWRDMITAQALPRAGASTPRAALLAIVEGARAICAGVIAAPVEEHQAGGPPAASMTLFCLRDPETRSGDMALYRVVHGTNASYVLSRTRRGEVSVSATAPVPEETLAQWRQDLAALHICREAEAGRDCGPAQR